MLGGKGKCVITRTRCPENGEPEKGAYCPCWVEVIETNNETGKTRVRHDCSHRVLLDWMSEAVRAGWSRAAETSKMRGEVAEVLTGALNDAREAGEQLRLSGSG